MLYDKRLQDLQRLTRREHLKVVELRLVERSKDGGIENETTFVENDGRVAEECCGEFVGRGR